MIIDAPCWEMRNDDQVRAVREEMNKVANRHTDFILDSRGAPPGRTGSRAAKAGTSNIVRAAAGRPAGRAGQHFHLARSARPSGHRDSGADMAVVRAGAQDITDHYPNPQGAPAVGHQAEPCAATGRFWVMRGYVQSRSDLPRPGWVTDAQRAQDRHHPDVAAGAVGGFIADGAGGGQYVTMPAKRKSQRWRHGGSGRDEAVTRPYRVTAWWNPRRGSRLRAASWRAGLLLASAVVKRRRISRDGGYRGHKARARGLCALAGFSPRGGSDGAVLAGLFASTVTERCKASLVSANRLGQYAG